MSVKFVPNKAGFEQLLNDPAVQAMVSSKTNAVKAYAEGLSESGKAKYNAKVSKIGDRVTGLVGTTDAISRYSNAKHNSLAKGIRNVHD